MVFIDKERCMLSEPNSNCGISGIVSSDKQLHEEEEQYVASRVDLDRFVNQLGISQVFIRPTVLEPSFLGASLVLQSTVVSVNEIVEVEQVED
jgi:hypothetical protein